MGEIHDVLGRWPEPGKARGVLATILHTEGHAYRKAGTAMLLLEDGRAFGHVSPGCIESDLRGLLPAVVANGATHVAEYDMTPDDAIWGQSSGCGGRIRILLEPLTPLLTDCLQELKRMLDSGLAVSLVRVFSAQGAVVGYMLRSLQSERAARYGEPELSAGSFTEWSTICIPRPRLIVYGAGADARPVAELAGRSGFRVTVCDWREALCSPSHFPWAERVLVGSPEENAKQLEPGTGDYVLVMSRDFAKDRRFLESLSFAPLRYLGILGSSSRSGRLLEALDMAAEVRTPVGLPIGAQGPEEIAVSIAAELIALKRSDEASLRASCIAVSPDAAWRRGGEGDGGIGGNDRLGEAVRRDHG